MSSVKNKIFSGKELWILAIILVSYFMLVLDVSIVITGLPKIQQTLGISSADLSWIQNAYTLAFGGLLLLGARAGDILGRKRMFLFGLAVFTLSSLAVALSQNLIWLVTARAAQGIGAAILAPSTLALLSTNFSKGQERTRAIAYYGAVAGIGASIGLVLGGIIADLFSWRICFYINGPIGILLILAARHFLEETEKHSGQFDLIGAIASTLGMTCLVFGMISSTSYGWLNPMTFVSFSAGIILIVILIINEAKAKQPIMPLRLFKHATRLGAYIGRFLYLGGMMGFWFFMTQFLQGVFHFSPLQAGFAFLPMTVANFIMAMYVPRFTQKWGNSSLLGIGLVFTLIGMFLLSFVSAGTNYWLGVAIPMILIGIGQGAALSPLTVAGVTDVEAKDAGAASGLVNVTHQLGGSLGLSILVVIFSSANISSTSLEQLLAHKVSVALLGSTVLLLLDFILVYFLVIKKRKNKINSN